MEASVEQVNVGVIYSDTNKMSSVPPPPPNKKPKHRVVVNKGEDQQESNVQPVRLCICMNMHMSVYV